MFFFSKTPYYIGTSHIFLVVHVCFMHTAESYPKCKTSKNFFFIIALSLLHFMRASFMRYVEYNKYTVDCSSRLCYLLYSRTVFVIFGGAQIFFISEFFRFFYIRVFNPKFYPVYSGISHVNLLNLFCFSNHFTRFFKKMDGCFEIHEAKKYS